MVLVPLLIQIFTSGRRPAYLRMLARSSRAWSRTYEAAYRRQRATDAPGAPDELAAARKKEADAAFIREGGNLSNRLRGPEAIATVLAAVVDDSRGARRDLLWGARGTVVTAGASVFAVLVTPVIG